MPRSIPFLVQYLAQEIITPDEPASRWSERDVAYRRLALAASTVAPQISIEA